MPGTTIRRRVYTFPQGALRRVRAWMSCVGAVAIFMLLAATGPAGASGAPARSAASLNLLGQSTWVAPGQSFDMHIGVVGPDPSKVSVELTLYRRLRTQSAFRESLGTASGEGPVLDRLAPVPLASVPADPHGGYDLFVPIGTGGSPPVPPTPFGVVLACQISTCAGVYPVRVALVSDSSGLQLASIVTQLVFVEPPPGTRRLRFAIVVPMSLPSGVTDAASGASVPAGSFSSFSREATSLSTTSLPVTLQIEPAAVAALEESSSLPGRLSSARSTLSALAAAAGAPSHESIASTYVPVDADALVSAGLGSYLSTQLSRAGHIMTGAGIHTLGGTWVSAGTPSAASVSELTSLGIHQMVLPEDALSGSVGTLTPTQPFTLSSGGGSVVQAVVSDPGLDTELGDAVGTNGVLAAHWLLADLALIYFEQPNLDTLRGVVAVAPTSWDPGRGFFSAFFSGLATSPVVDPVTVSSLLQSVPAGVDGEAAVRHLAPVPGSASAQLPAASIRAAGARLDAFESAVTNPGVIGNLTDFLLATQSSLLSPPERPRAVGTFYRELDIQLHQLALTSDRTITLTSTTGRVPVTILSAAPYPLKVILTLKSDGLAFPDGSTRTLTLGRSTNAAYLNVRTKTPGDFPVEISITSPSGGLVFLEGRLTIRSRAVSLMGIVLSVGAILILLAWWFRTARSGHSRLPAHARHRQARAGTR